MDAERRAAGPSEEPPPAAVTRSAAFRFWLQLGFISFGGPAGQIAILHRELVARRRWIAEREFLDALNCCMLLPGPEAQQLATYIGWRLHGVRGGLVAGTLFLLPSAILLALLSWIYARHGHLPGVAAVLDGVRPAVVAIVAAALITLGRRSLRDGLAVAIAIGAFVGLRFFHLPFPLIVIAAGILAAVLGSPSPPRPTGDSHEGRGGIAIDLHLAPARQRAPERHFVGVFDVASDRHAERETRDAQ